MSNAKEPSNVVDLGARLDPRESRVGDLLIAVRGIATQKLHALASNMFENVDDALFDLAEKAESNAAQTQYFDGMREVRKKRALVERSFLGQTTPRLRRLLRRPCPQRTGQPRAQRLRHTGAFAGGRKRA